MSRSTFRVLFYLKRNAPKKNGLVPVMCRITVNGKISQFSCKLDVEGKLWNVNLGRMSERSIVAQEANRMLDKIRVGINKAYQEITDRDSYVSAEKVICHGNPTIYKPRIETLELCSSEHSKVCFQPLKINGAASNLMFAETWQGMF
jgi:hypothetical protein